MGSLVDWGESVAIALMKTVRAKDAHRAIAEVVGVALPNFSGEAILEMLYMNPVGAVDGVQGKKL
ncbi:hypothetical protein NEA10_13705 [Phormidium yuhuli AB48]|uniref:Uncharacterized protein n=1 Tax=Phormidium yuhuli AB48 TaxID=2940671 RepID=A0ABY5AL34_9CYAN|nr:hypothetical protein [Phormidium yuhuli]USR89909.1 hypothetical protein NEA10_13705 [Phormidium yuhuli AB48]